MDHLNFDAIAGKVAGLAGAVVSMHFMQGTWPARVGMAVSGMVISYFGSPYLSTRTGLPEGLSGFLLGLFGMAIVSRLWDWWEAFPVAAMWQAILSRISKNGGT